MLLDQGRLKKLDYLLFFWKLGWISVKIWLPIRILYFVVSLFAQLLAIFFIYTELKNIFQNKEKKAKNTF